LVACGIWRSQTSQLCPLSARRCVNASSWRRCSWDKPIVSRRSFSRRARKEINAEAFQAPRRRYDDPPAAALLHDQLGQMEEAIVLGVA